MCYIKNTSEIYQEKCIFLTGWLTISRNMTDLNKRCFETFVSTEYVKKHISPTVAPILTNELPKLFYYLDHSRELNCKTFGKILLSAYCGSKELLPPQTVLLCPV